MSRKESLDGTAESGNNGGGGEIMLFGVRVKVDPMRKSVSMNNLSQYEQPNGNNTNTTNEAVVVAEDTGCASADDAVPHQSTGGRERKRGVPWTEEEHKLFLLGLQKVGKGDWRGISRNFVKTRTPTQVASHAQKYFLRKNNLNRRRRRRSSLFDITTDSVTSMPMEESKCQLENSNQQVLLPTSLPIPETARVTSNTSAYSVVPFPVTVGPVLLPMQVQNPMEILTLGKVNQVNNASTMILHPVPVVPIPVSSAMVDLNLNQRLEVEPAQLSLGLSLSSNQSQSSTRRSAFQVMSRFSNGDGIITVA